MPARSTAPPPTCRTSTAGWSRSPARWPRNPRAAARRAGRRTLREDKDRLAALLGRIAASGIAVLLVEHDMPLVMAVSDQVVVLDAGQRLAAGTPADVQGDPAVQRAYLGEALALAPAGTRAASRRIGAGTARGWAARQAGYGAGPVLHDIDLQVREGELDRAAGRQRRRQVDPDARAGRPAPPGRWRHPPRRARARRAARRTHRAARPGAGARGPPGVPGTVGADNLRLGAFLRPEGRDARVEDMLRRFPRLRERLQQRAGLLSGGEQQMLAVARGLMATPRVLLLDEPSLGLAPKVIVELFAALDTLRGERMTIVLVDQMASGWPWRWPTAAT
jgi:branched-chain amino acid transport system ATP-binding protein